MNRRRIFDIFVSFILACFSLIFVIPILIIVSLDGEGWPIFCQKRAGIGETTFWIFKIRTMRQAIKVEGTEDICLSSDNLRITRFGRWLRRTKVDESLQLINIFWGTMTFFGPRPMMERLAEYREMLIPDYHDRRAITPGAMCIAPLEGREEDIGIVRQLELDRYYIENRCYELDRQIFFATMALIFTGKAPELPFFANKAPIYDSRPEPVRIRARVREAA